MATDVRHNEKLSRYELVLNDKVVGIADYHSDGDVLVFPHTEIDRPLQGRGLGEQLVRGALDDVRRRDAKVRPLCWFVRDFIRDNPEYSDLRAA
jgi:predicted GNAT family acetyltransferase